MKHLIVLGLAALSTILFIAGIATPLATTTFGSTEITNSLWKTCVGSDCTDITSNTMCTSAWHTYSAGRAFGVMAVLLAGCMTLFGVFNACSPDACAGIVRKGFIVFAFLTVFVGLLFWSVAVGLYTVGQCDQDSASKRGWKMGIGAPLGLAAWFLAIIVIIIELASGGTAKKKEEGGVIVSPSSGSGGYNAVV